MPKSIYALLGKSEEQLPDRLQLKKDAFKKGRFIALLQDFLYLDNPGAKFLFYGSHTKQEDAEHTVAASGQRYPCLVVEAIETNGKTNAMNTTGHIGLENFKTYTGDWIILGYADRRNDTRLFSILAVALQGDDRAQIKLFERLKVMNHFAVLAKIVMIGDSERQYYHGVEKTASGSMVNGL